jgi:hypothetical protein
VRMERLDELKYPMTSSGIEQATFRLVASVQVIHFSRVSLSPSLATSGEGHILGAIKCATSVALCKAWDLHSSDYEVYNSVGCDAV